MATTRKSTSTATGPSVVAPVSGLTRRPTGIVATKGSGLSISVSTPNRPSGVFTG